MNLPQGVNSKLEMYSHLRDCHKVQTQNVSKPPRLPQSASSKCV
jgi:hypothetical protein